VERDIFGALLGTLAGVLVCRLVLLLGDVSVFLLLLLLAVGAWSGGFIAHMGWSSSERAALSVRAWAQHFRRICLRAMLWLLGAAAVFGVLSVLTASYDVVGRIAGTAAITAVVAGLLWPFSILMDHETNRGLGLFGALSVIASYVLVLPTIWDFGHRGEESVITGVIVMLMMPVGLVALKLAQTRIARVSGLVGLVLYGSVLTLFLIALWHSDRWYRNEDWWETGFALSAYGAISLACLVGAATGDRRYWRWLGVVASLTAFGMCLWGIWIHTTHDPDLLVVVTSVAIAVGHANLTMLVPLRGGQNWLRYVTICTVAITAVCLDIDVLFSLSDGPGISIVARIALAAGILASCGTLGLVLLTGLNRIMGHHRVEAGPADSIGITCPQCGKRQTIALGDACCCRCQLRIQVRIEQPAEKTRLTETKPYGDVEPFG
jgi:hypothetical protein